jgi:hypothetical protein
MKTFKAFGIILGIFIGGNISLHAQDTLPPLNRAVLQYVESVIGKKVDRGECWDLANQALTRINAKWDHQFKYGRLLNPQKDTIYPGDIIQFKDVLVETITRHDDGSVSISKKPWVNIRLSSTE